jgi:TolB protein
MRDSAYSDDESYRDPAGRDQGYFDVNAGYQGMSLDDAARLSANHILKPFGDDPTIIPLSVSGRDARLILPDANSPQLYGAELIVPYSSPLGTYDFFFLYAHKDFIRSLSQTLELTN